MLAALFLSLPIVARADFPAPNPEELKMSAEPKAPGAAAVYLDREQITIDNKHFETLYERIKVLTEKGKELATVKIPYAHGEFYIKEVEGRTIHADGTVIPLTVKPSDLVDFKAKGLQLNSIVFTLPSVEVGSILEYRIKFSYDDETAIPPTWMVQQKYFTREAHFQFHPTEVWGNGYRPPAFTTNLPDAKKIVKDKRGFTLDLTDIPAEPNEDWMPPLNNINWRVQFYYTLFSDDSNYWQLSAGYWASDVDDFIKPTPLLSKTVQEVTSATDTPMAKATKLYAAVMKLENTDFTRARSEEERKKEKLRKIKSAEDVWKNQSGDSAAIALLYMALGRAAGLTIYPMQVVDRDRAIFDPDYHSEEQLDDFLVIVAIDGKEVYLDPGEKMCPFGQLHWRHTLATGLRESEGGPKVARTPVGSYKNSSVKRIAEVDIAADGTVAGNIRLVMTGPESLHWRQAAIRDGNDAVKKDFNEALKEITPEGSNAEFDHFINLDDYNSALVATARISGALGAHTGKRLIVPGLFFASHARHPFVAQDKRVTPIDVHHPQITEDDVTYNLPAGLSAESAPEKTQIEWAQHGMLRIDSKIDGSSVNVMRSLAYNYAMLGASDYGDLRGFYQKVATADQQQVVLTRAAPKQGQ
jgi:hypothetical protein